MRVSSGRLGPLDDGAFLCSHRYTWIGAEAGVKAQIIRIPLNQKQRFRVPAGKAAEEDARAAYRHMFRFLRALFGCFSSHSSRRGFAILLGTPRSS